MTPGFGRTSQEVRGAGIYARTSDKAMSDHDAVPVWVHRMHADGLPSARAAPAASPTDSQRFIDRWDRVEAGY